jgi:hypothetical protein
MGLGIGGLRFGASGRWLGLDLPKTKVREDLLNMANNYNRRFVLRDL